MWRRKKPRAAKELSPKEIATLVEASNVSAEEIQRWHSDFLHHYPTGLLDKKTFTQYYQRFHPNTVDDQISSDNIFDMIDANHDGTVDFNELLLVIVLMNHLNDLGSRLSFAFDIWDGSNDGYIDQEELSDVISAVYDHTGITDRKGDRDPKKRAKEIISKHDTSGDKRLSKEEFVTGCKNDPVIRGLLAHNA